MNRKLVSLLLALSMVFSLLPIQAFAGTSKPVDTDNPFEDVKQGSWYYDAVQYTRVNGIFAGTGKTTFRPEGAMTRGMFVTVLGRMAGVNPDDYTGPTQFSDVPENAFYAPYVAWAAKYGITVGTGGGKFSPNAGINRQQMAVFFVRYFETFDVDYETGADITTTPADLDSVSPWARDAVLKLWRTGLLVGDGGNFDPMGGAARAQAASICFRTDEAVAVWYSEPGVPSARVRINPATGLPCDDGSQPGKPSGGGSGGSSGGGTTTTTYYMVTFALGTNQTGMTLPNSGTYPANTQIGALPTPTAAEADKVFLGWYYDAAMSRQAKESELLTGDVTLYARVGDGTKVTEADTPNYIAAQDLPADFPLKLGGSYQEGDLTITNVTANNANVTFNVESGVVKITGLEGVDEEDTTRPEFSGRWNPGDTYKAVLKDGSSAVFLNRSDVEQALTIRTYNFTIKRDPVTNLGLDGGLKYIPKSAVSNMTAGLEGLFQVSLVQGADGQTQKVTGVAQTGSFTYSGNETLAPGDTVAIYETKGNRALDSSMTLTDSDHVAYVEITSVSGNTYSYKTADTEDVLFTPDVLPVKSNKKAAGDGGTLTLTENEMSELRTNLANMGLDANITLDRGDFIAFYEGNLTGQTRDAGNQPEYGKITNVSKSGDTYTVAYSPATESDVLSAMDVYTEKNKEIELTQEQIEKIQNGIAQQAVKSGFLDNAARELTALALETDGFQKLAEDFDLESYAITFADGTPAGPEDLALMSGTKVEITKKEISPKVHIGNLDHFDGSKGIRVELVMNLTIEVGENDKKLVIELQAAFEQEVMLSVNASGGAIWKWAFIIPYIYDYRLNANIDVGTYTGIGITATAKTQGGDDGEFDWNMTTENSAGDKIIDIGKQIKDLMEEKDKFMGKDLVGGDDDDDDGGGIPISGGLAEKYAAMIEDAGEDTSWIEIFRHEIFAEEGSVDPFHILCYGVSADFVVKANFYVTLGMTFEYGAAKRYNFSIMLFHKESTNETIDLETPHYRFAFYVMGTMGIKAGVEFEIGVGLFSLKLDSIGICAEAGAYAQMWGYFYYEATWEQGSGKNSQYSGAMLIEIGVYLEISFKAQLFSSDKLTYQPTIYEHQWPILTVGEQENVFAFADYDDDGNDIRTEYDMMAVTTLSLPSALFSMQYLDMQSGETGGDKDDDGKMQPGRNWDDDTESHFTITMSDSRYAYDPATNTVTVSPGAGAVELPACTMTIRWKNGVLAFTSQPIERVVTITWSNPANVRYIAFNSMGGSAVNQIAGAAGTAITQPAPTKVGYGFEGWYTDRACTNEYPFPNTLPENFNGEQGITLYAKWKPNLDTPYTVEHYQEELNGTYTRTAIEKLTGETDARAAVTAQSYDHFTVKEVPAVRIAPNGSTVVRVYYDRNKYQVAFTYGTPAGMSTVPEAKTYTAKYGAKVYAPLLSLEGYRFTGFSPSISASEAIEVTGAATYAAQWTVRDDTPYRVEHYLQRVSGEGYLLDRVESKTGTTGAAASAVQKTISGFTCNRTEPASATIAPNGSTVVKLYYDRESYTLTLNPEGGTLTGGATKTLLFGAPITAETPVKAGYTFAGWFYTKDSAEVRLQAGDTMPAGNLTLTAKWTARGDIPYQVEHYWQDADTGDYALHETENLTGATGAAVTAAARTYEHYSQNASAAGTVASGTIATDGGLTLKLYYDLDTVTVTFEPNGGTMAEADKTKTFRYGQSFSGPTPTRTGYGFEGWFSAGTKYDSTAKVTADVTLTAQWAEGQVGYKVEHYLMELSGNYPATASHRDDRSGKTGSVIDLNSVKRTDAGFTFDHAGESSYTVAGDGSTVVKLYYSRNRYTLTWELNGGTAGGSYTPAGQVYYGAAITKPTVTRTGYTPTWGEVPAAMPAGDVTGTVTWTANARAVTFEPNGGDGDAVTKTFTYGQTNTPPTFTRTGYTLKGWGESPTSTETVSPYALPAAGTTPVTLYAVWEPVSYTITYELNDGTNHTGNPKNYTVTDEVTLAAPTRTGYNFLGWYTDPTHAEGSKVTGISAGSTGNRTFYARWEKIQATVLYLPWPDLYEGITGIDELLDEGYTLPGNLKAGDNLPTKDAVQMKEGYYFQGWVADLTTPVLVTKMPDSAAEPYTVYMAYTKGTISSVGDLVSVAKVSETKTESNYYRIMLGGDYKLTEDVTLPTNWDGIDRFNGSLDGQGHTITYPNGMTAKPLFRGVNTSTGNVAVQNVNISIGENGGGTVNVPADAGHWGLIAGDLASGTIRSCTVSGGTIYNSNATSSTSLSSIGGIAGRVNANGGAIENCSVGTATAPLCIENCEDNNSGSGIGGIVGVLSGTCSFAGETAPSYVVLNINTGSGHYALYGGIAGNTGANARLEFGCAYDLYVSSNKESNAYEKLGAITGMYTVGGSITISSGAALRVHSALRDMERGKQSGETGSLYVSIARLDGGDTYVTFTKNGTYSKDAENVPAVPSAASAAVLGLRAVSDAAPAKEPVTEPEKRS